MSLGTDWPDTALRAFGIVSPAGLRVDAGSARFRLGRFPAGLWLLPPSALQTALRSGEALAGTGLAAAVLRAGSGRPYILLGGRTAALLTVWNGTELPRVGMARELEAIAGFLGRLRHAVAGGRCPEMPEPGSSWIGSWRKRLRRLDAFAVIAGRRLHPTGFDRVFLARFGRLREEADLSLRELEAAARHLPSGLALGRIARPLFYRREDGGVGLKNPACLAAGEPLRSLYRLLVRYLPRSGFAPRAAASALAAYYEGRSFAREELAALAAALRFPEDYYRLACRYFLPGEPWPLRTFLRLERRIWAAGAARRSLVEEISSLPS